MFRIFYIKKNYFDVHLLIPPSSYIIMMVQDVLELGARIPNSKILGNFKKIW